MFLLYPGGGWIGLLVLIGTALFSWFFLRKYFFRTWEISLPPPEDNLDPLEILKRRYARGEITREQYLEMRKDLED